MAKEKESSFSGFGIGLLVGAIVGVAIGLLYAPRPGSETRGMLKEMSEATVDQAKGTAAELKEKMSQRMGASGQDT